MDLSEYLKLGLKDLCKPKQASRVVQIRHLRQQNRDKYMMSQRQIVESVENTPEVQVKKVRRPLRKQAPIEPEAPKVNKRMEALLLWRAEKAKKMEVEKNSNKSKPVFKVSKVVAPTKLEDIYPNKASQKPSFVGSTHHFKPPKNIKPIPIHQTTVSQNTRSKSQTSKSKNDTAIKKAPIKRTARAKDTRGKANNTILDKINEFGDALKVSNTLNTIPKINLPEETKPSPKMNKTPSCNAKTKKSRRNKENDSNDTPKHSSKKRNTEKTTPKESNLQVMEVTPQKSPNAKPNEVVYVSPFVTIARGKSRAREEYKSRASMGGTLAGSPNFTGPKAAANYFYNLKAEQIARLQGLINEWTKYSENQDLPEGAGDIINATIGQTNLLLNKKMERFQQLIENCENQNTDPLVNATDLHGYWDVVTIQIDSIDKRYENLVRMRDNGWEEILPIPKRTEEVAAPRPKKKVAVKKKTEVQGSSKLRGAIRLARQKQQMASSEGSNCFDGGFFSIQSPKKSPAKPRKSLLKSVLSSSKGTPKHSPGLTMMKVAHNIKSIKEEQDSGSKSTGKKLKTVLFADEVMDCNRSSSEDDKENFEKISVKEETPRCKRQSVRLSSRSKLF